MPDAAGIAGTTERNGGIYRNLEADEPLLLVVDDEPQVLNVGVTLLAAKGYRVIGFSEPEGAFWAFTELATEVAALLTDLAMPSMSGEELYFKMRQLAPDLRVLIISGYAESDAIERLLDEGIREFLHKPYTPDQLFSMVESLLRE